MGKKRTWATAEELAQQRRNDIFGQRAHEFADYQKEAPGIQQQQINDTRRSFANTLNQGVNNLNKNANSSGMLYSGRRAAGEAGMRGQGAMNFLSEKNAIASRMKNYLDTTNTDITNQRYGIMTNNANDALASAQAGAAKAMAQQAQISGLMNAGGQVAGGMGGGQSKPNAGNTPVVAPTSYSAPQNNRNANSRMWMTASSGP